MFAVLWYWLIGNVRHFMYNACMVLKFIKAAFLIILYLVLYIFIMLLTQIVIGLTIGGAGSGLMELVRASGGQPIDASALNEAANLASLKIDDYVQKNTGLIFSISALVSLLIFNIIFKIRKKELVSIVGLDRRPSATDIKYGAFVGASAHFAISMVVLGFQYFNLFGDAFEQHDAHMTDIFGTGGMGAMFLGIGLIMPLVEEILFRGMISYELSRVIPLKAVIIVQGVIFGLYHMVPVQIFYTIPFGIYLGFIVYKTGSIWPAAAGHMAMNIVSVLLTSPSAENILSLPQFSMIFMIVSIYMLVSAFNYFQKKKPALPAPTKIIE